MLNRTPVVKTELASQSGSPLVITLLRVSENNYCHFSWHLELEKAGVLLGQPVVYSGDSDALDAYQSLVRWATHLSLSGAL